MKQKNVSVVNRVRHYTVMSTQILFALILELSFSKSGGVHDSYTFQCGLVRSLTSPGIHTRKKGPTAFSVPSERHWQSGVNGIAKVPKRSFPQWDSNPAGTVRSPVQANALTHSATAPPHANFFSQRLLSGLLSS